MNVMLRQSGCNFQFYQHSLDDSYFFKSYEEKCRSQVREKVNITCLFTCPHQRAGKSTS